MKEKVSLMFDLRYMNFFSKVSTTLSDQVTISLSSKLPAVVEYKIAEMGYIRYYMLPREEVNMQNEGDEMQRIQRKIRCRTDDLRGYIWSCCLRCLSTINCFTIVCKQKRSYASSV